MEDNKNKKEKPPRASTNYLAAFDEAQSFLTAAEAISKKVSSLMLQDDGFQKAVSLQHARYVNHSYAVELLLKCITIIENGQYYEGHNLLKLFQKLNPNAQASIIARFDEYKIIRRDMKYFGFFEKVDLLTVLEEAGTAFIEFRYLFEGKKMPDYELNEAVRCLHYYIEVIKPELKPNYK